MWLDEGVLCAFPDVMGLLLVAGGAGGDRLISIPGLSRSCFFLGALGLLLDVVAGAAAAAEPAVMADTASGAATAIANVVMAAMAATSADDMATAGSASAAAAAVVAVANFAVAASWPAVAAADARAYPLGLSLFTRATILSLSRSHSHFHSVAGRLLPRPLVRGLLPDSCTRGGVGILGMVGEGQQEKLICSLPLCILTVSFAQRSVAAHS